MPQRVPLYCSILLTLVVASTAHAQMNQPGTGPGGMPNPPPPPETKPEGVAEQAPKEPGVLPTTPVLPPPKNKRQKLHVFELDGYFRFRGDWLKNLNLGFNDNPATGFGGAPFPRPLACHTPGENSPNCRNSIKTSNIRLRLEPTVHIDERASVHMQLDVLDNLVLGSTPVGSFGDRTDPRGTSLGVITGNQGEPSDGRNSNRDSIVVKRAWGELATALGLLKFGRMPAHWGAGILDNSGSHDPIHGGYDLDSDYGDTVDRLYFSTIIPGTSFRGAIAMDWGASRPSSDQLNIFRGAVQQTSDDRQSGQAIDLDDTDDVNQYLFVISKLDTPEKFRERAAEGKFVLNFGTYFAYRTQGHELRDYMFGTNADLANFRPRNSTLYIPDGWVRMGLGDLELEVELTGVFGDVTVDEVSTAMPPTPITSSKVKVRSYGGVARLGYSLLDGDLKFQGEVGYASGDQYDSEPAGSTHISNRPFPPRLLDNGGTFRAFQFDPNYRIDLILFRELIGAVTNATYVRPSVSYNLSENFVLRGAGIVSFANREISTPGNAKMYGVELNADVGYESEIFHAGLAYGVLFPLSALNHPAGLREQNIPLGPAEFENNAGDAGAAQTIQMRLLMRF